MTHTENLICSWRTAATEAEAIAERYRNTDPVTRRAGETSAEVHRKCAIALGIALKRDAAELADEPWDYEKEDKTSEALLASLKQFMVWLESGQLVRDISHDASPDWAPSMMEFAMALGKAQQAILLAEKETYAP